MDTLRYLEGKDDFFAMDIHPMFGLNQEQKYCYCFGIGVMALGSMKSLMELREVYRAFLDKIGIEEEAEPKIMGDINEHFSDNIRNVFQLLSDKRIATCFFVDLYKIMEKSLWSLEYCKNIMNNYFEVTHTNPEIIAFCEAFYKACHKDDLERALAAYEELQHQGFEMDYDILKYFYPNFMIEDHYKDIHIMSGKTLLLQHKVYIDGDIILEPGASLLLQGAEVIVKGRLQANGSRVWIRDSNLDVVGCKEEFFMNLLHVAVIRIEASTIDCHNKCGFLKQDSGRLILRDSEIRNVERARAVFFEGQSVKMDNVLFQHVQGGSIYFGKPAKAVVNHCKFLHCSSDYGGGIYSESIEMVRIYDCDFQHCEAKYLGAAIYFRYEKFGQVVRNCTKENCVPAEDACFNCYMDDSGLETKN